MNDLLPYNNNELLLQIARGNEKAFDALFLEMYPALCLVASRLLEDQELARDTASEVFAQLWENRTSLTHVKDIRAYLYISARNRALNQLKKKRVTEAHEANAVRQLPDELPAEEMLHAIYDAESIRVLKQAILRLPAECRKVVFLGMEGFTNNEIARQLGISASAVSNQKARAIRLLQHQMPLSLLLSYHFLFQ